MKKNFKRLAGLLIILSLIFAIPIGLDVLSGHAEAAVGRNVPADSAGAQSGAKVPTVYAEAQAAVALQSTSVSVINNFGSDPRTERNFTWDTPLSMKTGFIEYSPKDQFQTFDAKNIIVVQAQSYASTNDAGSRMIHKVSLKDLRPGTEYVYRVGNGTNLISTQGTFQTAGNEPGPFTFIQITDTQGSNAKDYGLWKNTLDKALTQFPGAKFLLHTGDMVDSGEKIQQWDLFTDSVKDELMNLPIEPTVGNHEAINRNQTNTNEKNFSNTFDLPENSSAGAPSGTVYSFDYGYAHIAVLNTELSAENLKKEGEWLKADMEKSDKPWKIVSLHRGPYGATYDSSDIRNAWTPIFDQTGVDLVLQGHDHNYVRTFPMNNKTKVKAGKGTVYITANSGGVKFYPLKRRSWQAVDLQPNTQMFVAVTVDKNKLILQAYDVNGTLRDTLTQLQ